MPPTKLAKIRAAAAAGDWATALRIASKFDRLGEHREAIKRGAEALWHPSWAEQLGRDPDRDIERGVAALKARYGL
jgi:hypothetical protein